MLNEHHNLALEFPEYKDKIHELKTSSAHFRRLMDEHHNLDKQIRRVEIGEQTMTDEALEDIKKQRLMLKDECYSMLTSA